ncbi:MAG: hypothetical protein SOV68_07325 [Ligilactobacillus salivarius]|nr:hypothetical protein [Ligilactobacillus salivarius]
MIIIINNSNNFNITDKNKLEIFNKSVNPTNVLCSNCPFRNTCKHPKAIFYGHYPHKVLLLFLVNGKAVVKQVSIFIQRILGKGCGKTSSLVPSHHIPYHQFIFNDAINILLDNLNEKVSHPFFHDLKQDILIKFNITNKMDLFISDFNKAIKNKDYSLYPKLLEIFHQHST